MSVPCLPLPDNVPQLWLSSYSIHSKKLFILRTSRHVYKEREQCNAHPHPQCPALKTISSSNLLPSTRAPVDGLEANPRCRSSSVNTGRTFLLKVSLLSSQVGKRVNFILWGFFTRLFSALWAKPAPRIRWAGVYPPSSAVWLMSKASPLPISASLFGKMRSHWYYCLRYPPGRHLAGPWWYWWWRCQETKQVPQLGGCWDPDTNLNLQTPKPVTYFIPWAWSAYPVSVVFRAHWVTFGYDLDEPLKHPSLGHQNWESWGSGFFKNSRPMGMSSK